MRNINEVEVDAFRFVTFIAGMCFGCSVSIVMFVVIAKSTGLTYNDGVEDTRMEALDAGVAEWPRNGEFKWKEAVE